MFHGARTIYCFSEEAIHRILYFSLFDADKLEASQNLLDHLSACYTPDCPLTRGFVQQVNSLRSTARDMRSYINSMEDALLFLRISNEQHLAFETFDDVPQRLGRTMSIEVRNGVLHPPLLSALQTLLLSTPNIVRLAINGGIVDWYQLQAQEILQDSLALLRTPAYSSLQSITLDVPNDLTQWIRGKLDVRTLRLVWKHQQFTFSPPMTWNNLQNLRLDLRDGDVPSDLLRILTEDTIPNVRKLELYSVGNTHQIMALVDSLSGSVEELKLIVSGDTTFDGIPTCPNLQRLSCLTRSAQAFLSISQPRLSHLDVLGSSHPTDPLSFDTAAMDNLLKHLVQKKTTLVPQLGCINALFISRPLVELNGRPSNVLDTVAAWKIYDAASGGQFALYDARGRAMDTIME